MCVAQLSHFHIYNIEFVKIFFCQESKEGECKDFLSDIDKISMNSNLDEEDYLDQLSHLLPWHRSLTLYERVLIGLIVSIFVSIVGCILCCLACQRSALRRYYSRKRLSKCCLYVCHWRTTTNHFRFYQDHGTNIVTASASRKNTLVLPPPPSYESIVKTDSTAHLHKLIKSQYLDLGRKLSYGTTSDSDGTQPSEVSIFGTSVILT